MVKKLGGGGGGVTITPDSSVGQALSDGSFMVYTYANSAVLVDMLTEDDGVTLGLSDLPKGAVSYIPTANKETNYQESNNEAPHWWWLAGGIALAAVGIKAFDDSDNNVNTPTKGKVTITGTATENEKLTANTSALNDGDGVGTFSYQWWANDGTNNLAIAGATNKTLALTQAQVGKTITVVVTHTDAQGTVEPAKTSTATTAVANINDPTTGVVTIDEAATATEDQTLTANTSALQDEDGKGTFTYQWQADDVAISGEINNTLILTQAHVGKAITVVVIHTDAFGTVEPAITSTATAAVENVNDPTTGVVTITGTATEDQNLTADTSALADEDGKGTFTYQWQADNVAISGATSATLTLTQAHVGKIITLKVIHTDAFGNVEPVITSVATAAVENVNDLTTGEVIITGTAREDKTLTANTSALMDEDGLGAFSYQWQADGADIMGATNSTFTLTQAQVGKIITVEVSYTDAFGTVEPVITSDPTVAVENVNDPTTGVVTITGTATEDQNLTADTSALADEDGKGTFTYQWQADNVAISGATSATLTLTQAHVGKIITLKVIHTDAFGNVEPVITSVPTAAVENVNDLTTGEVIITGTAREDKTLTVNTSALMDEDGLGAFSYQWQADGTDIMGANNSTFTLTQAQVGKIITVEVSYTDAFGTVEPAITSDPTVAVENVNDLTTGEVTITGAATATPKQGETLTAVSTVTDEDGLGTFSYQWQADDVAIANSNNPTLILTQAQVGKTITAVVSYTDGYGTPETVTSDPTVAVENVNDLPMGEVTITGAATATPKQGETLTAVSTVTDEDGLGTFSYQWQADNVDIENANDATLTLTQAQVGKTITVVVSYTDALGADEMVTSMSTTAVENVNDAPSITGEPATTVAEDAPYSFTPTGADIDGDTLVYSITNKPAWATFDPVTGVLSGTPTNANVGTAENIVISVTDNNIAVPVSLPPFSITVTNENDAPTITGTPDATVAEDAPYSFTPTGADIDGDTLVYSITNKPDWATFDPVTGVLSGTPTNVNVGIAENIVISVTDNNIAVPVSLPAFSITVTNENDAPIITGTPDATVAEDAPYSFTPTGADIDGDTLVYSITNKPDWATFDPVTGVLSGTPTNANVGIAENIVISVTDNNIAAPVSLPPFSITVTNENDAPTITGTPDATVAEDAPYSFTPTGADIDGDTLVYSITNKPAWATFDPATGELSGTPTNVNVGIAENIVISVTDNNIAVPVSLPAFSITVSNENDLPTGTVTITGTATENQELTAVSTLADVDGLGQLSYQWQANGADIANANSATFILTQAQVGQTITVVVSYTDGYGASETVTSAATAEVASTAPAQTVTIDMVSDDVSTHGSAMAAIAAGTTTDDTTPTLTGTLSAALTGDQVLEIYDGSTKLGGAMVSGTDWTYTPSALTAGSHSFTARVQDPMTGLSPASAPYVVNINPSISMTVTDDVGSVMRAVNLGVRYILLKQTGDSIKQLSVNEVEVISDGTNIALGKTVTVGESSIFHGALLSGVTGGSLIRTDGYSPIKGTTDNWVLVDLDGYYSVESVNLYALSSSNADISNIKNVAIFASNEDLSRLTYAQLLNAANAIPLGNTGATPSYKTILTTAINNTTNDSTPTLTGTLTTALGMDEELAIYDGTNKLAVVMVDNSDHSWTFTTPVLTDELHTFTAVIQAKNNTDIANARVISAVNAINIDSSITAPTQTATITAVSDDVSTHGSVEGAIATGETTDDTTPTLTGTLSAALTGDQVLAIYDGSTKLGEATVTTTGSDTTWTYTPNSALPAGSHSFTAQAESPAGGNSTASTAHVVNINPGISMTIADNEGAVMADLNPAVRYILLKQTGDSTDQLQVSEVEVYLDGTNIAENKTVTAGAYGIFPDWLPSGVTDGNLERVASHSYASNQATDDNWLLIDLGAYYSRIDSVNVYALGSSGSDIINIRNVDIFASNEDFSSQSHTDLIDNVNAIRLGGTGSAPSYTTSLTTAINNTTDDNTPTLSGTLAIALGAGEELAIYNGTTKLGVAMVDSDNTWTFTHMTVLPDGDHTFKAVIQATDVTAIANGRVISAAYTITIDTSAVPAGVEGATAAQGAAAAPEALYSSYASPLEASLEASVEAKDPISGLSVKTYSLPSTAKDQTLDFPDEHTEINVVNIAGSGANTVKIQLDDVLQSGINLFNDANGWDGLDGAGKHQLVVNGDADDTLVLDSMAEAESWIKEGTTTNSDHTYLVYQFEQNNADGVSQVLQVLVDQDMIRDGAIL